MAGRLPKGVKEERENFMLGLFRADPNLSVAKANAKFKEKFNSMMRNARAYELRELAQKEAEKQAGAPTPPPAQRRSQRLLLIEGDKNTLETTKGLVQALSDSGVPVQVDHETEGHLILKT